MLRKSLIAVALVGGVLGLHGQSALAGTYGDANDVGNALDIKEVEMQGLKLGGHRHLMTTVRTYEDFRQRDLRGGGFTTYFDSRGGKRWDYKLTMNLYEGIYPYCEIYTREGFARGGGQVERNPSSFSCTFARSTLDPRDGQIRFRTVSVYYQHRDSAPESGRFRF
jgi:hypothetical protein